MQIVLEYLEILLKGRGLLGFSGGGDSVALFFLLKKEGVNFDIAILDHGLRAQSQEEIAYAKHLAEKYSKRVHIGQVHLSGSNLEARYRKERYSFFERIIQEFNYTHLILAHHLNDKLEWFFMQLAKGSSLQTLLGFSALEKRVGYDLIRPLIYTQKRTLREYLHTNKYRYFEDETNFSPRFKRNIFRQCVSNPFLEGVFPGFNVARGLVRSFKALEKEKQELYPAINPVKVCGVWVFATHLQNLYYITSLLKNLGYVLSAKQRLELEKNRFNGVFVTAKQTYFVGLGGGLVYVGMAIKNDSRVLPKPYKQACRLLKIPPHLRPLFLNPHWEQNFKILKTLVCAQSN
ncbi:tRNA lysidine(34) synthetase TilS [Helicobacter suis]|uniref:tRNA lysidine(34) synthetase TilS n=1 Tax=Helicobacter suis TaxID=104628 RepID=UPI002492E439|nr:tRNA lysidine(34) synthetase TilS [Helicobacter suis]